MNKFLVVATVTGGRRRITDFRLSRSWNGTGDRRWALSPLHEAAARATCCCRHARWRQVLLLLHARRDTTNW